MEYVNLETGVRVNLDGLTPEEKRFYRQARQRFQEQASWLAFDEFAFGMRSPIYHRQRSHIPVLKSPLYRFMCSLGSTRTRHWKELL